MNKRNESEEAWLMDAEVRYMIKEKNSRWEVSLVFIDTTDSDRFLIQNIGDYRSKRRAEIYAINMQRTAAKDLRGTQKINGD